MFKSSVILLSDEIARSKNKSTLFTVYSLVYIDRQSEAWKKVINLTPQTSHNTPRQAVTYIRLLLIKTVAILFKVV